MELTLRQKSVYDFICRYHQRHSMAPSVREICDHLGLRGPAGVHRILNILIEKGYLHATHGRKRSWIPVRVDQAGFDPSDFSRSRAMPLVGSAAAGSPLGLFEVSGEYLPIDPMFYGHEGCFAVRVAGDSMIDAHILDGDIAVIRPCETAENGDTVAVMVDEILPEAVLKLFYRDRGTITLVSANSEYQPLVFKGKECRKVRIIGRCVGIIRRAG